MIRALLLSVLLVTLIASSAQNQTNVIAIVGATVVDGTGTDALMLSFELARPAGATGWLELDNIRFFK